MDTQRIVSDIIGSGLTQTELASLVPCGQSTISFFLRGKRGKRVSKLIGDRLQAIHAERCGTSPVPTASAA
ncbi:helix-turn-helix domain-containing protein [Paraburkholderia bannensis]|uniref:helix-turn-helix domain-containing protein n=1 Tax=Paraburkholderia bannensis TaxID=765414 RepID=UPI002AB7B92A|nr:helix-turn-helix transcriptional regulator [Paraburkholderia bannensis]